MAASLCLLSFGLTDRLSAQTFEAENLSPVGTGATVSISNDTNASGGVIEFLNSTAAGQSMTFTTPSIAAGTYQLQLRYKNNTSRGQHTVTVDGTQVGGTVDQYATTSTYVTVTLGNVTLSSSGAHTIVMNVTGKNASATQFYVTADTFTFTLQSGGGGGTPPTVNFEAENLTYTPSGATASVQTDTNSSGGKWVELAGNSVGDSISYAIPSVVAGTYQVQMEWKGNNSRGIIQLAVDGTNLGSTLDQYASGQTYPTTTFGTVTFNSAGTHTITLTVTGKNSASSNYQISSDKFTFVGQSGTGPSQVADPSFSPVGGTYSNTQSVAITTSTPGATVRYTTNGSAPSETAGTVYSSPVSVSSSEVLTAIAYESGFTDSNVTSASYTIGTGPTQVAAPVFSPAGGSYSNAQNVSITTTTGGATIHYTTDGSTPSETAGTVYSGAVNISSTKTLKAIAFESGFTDSTVTSATYNISTGGNGTPNGQPILPPKWAFGVMYGSYDNQTGVLSNMTQLRNSYCGDLMWIDSSWLGSNYNGPGADYIDFKFDPSQFANPASMISTLHSNHFHFGVWEWPWIDKSNSFYSTGASKHYFIENSSGAVVNGGGWHGVTFTGQFDLSTSAGSTWWKSLNQPLFDIGFDFLKMDTTVGIPSGGVLVNGSSSSTDWKGFYHKAAWEITATATLAQGRGLLLAHSDAGAATNNDQYPGLWTGDSSATFASMISKDMGDAFKCNTKTSGAYWCGDTGGYNGTSNDELYQRWLEYGCFTPLTEFFGAKGEKGSNSNIGRFPWCFSTAAQATFSHYTQLRYQLLPYRYSNAQACYHITGTVQYPVWWPNSTQIINGHGTSEILVQPVTTASATSASVKFPSGMNWIDYNSGTIHAGGSTATISAPVNQVPMFVSAGAIIPMLIPYDSSGNAIRQDYVDEFPANPLTIDTYPSGSTSYTLYEDDGISDLYITDNEFSTTVFSSDNTSGHEVLTVGAANGSFAGQLSSRTYYLKLNQQTSAPASVTRDGNTESQVASKSALVSASEGWYYDSANAIVWVKFTTSTSVSTSVSLH
ncbi:MAG TPA: TIM-barrel domain-containing protein [Opitutaceae bacterium]|nr:TIM-barrel domain-containing protein [Opitutaceae bacterium]